MEILPEKKVTAWRKADCAPDVRYKLTPITAALDAQLGSENLDFGEAQDGKGRKVRFDYGVTIDTASRYAVKAIEGLTCDGKLYSMVLDPVDADENYGMRTIIRADSWERVPNILKKEIYKLVNTMGDLTTKERDELGFMSDSQAETWNPATDASVIPEPVLIMPLESS